MTLDGVREVVADLEARAREHEGKAQACREAIVTLRAAYGLTTREALAAGPVAPGPLVERSHPLERIVDPALRDPSVDDVESGGLTGRQIALDKAIVDIVRAASRPLTRREILDSLAADLRPGEVALGQAIHRVVDEDCRIARVGTGRGTRYAKNAAAPAGPVAPAPEKPAPAVHDAGVRAIRDALKRRLLAEVFSVDKEFGLQRIVAAIPNVLVADIIAAMNELVAEKAIAPRTVGMDRFWRKVAVA